jgi:undecaprenyl-diphosphatase
MTDATAKNTGSIVTQHDNGRDSRRAFLDPSTSGPAQSLVQSVAREHGVTAIVLATIASFVVMGTFIVALGLLVTHVLEHGSIGVWDHHVSQWFYRHRTGDWNRISGDVTNMADTFEVAGVAAVVTIVLLIRRWGRHALLFVAGLLVELSVFLTANKIVARPRPAVSHMGGTPSTFSFPSGHTAATVVLYGGIAVIVTVATRQQWLKVVMWAIAVVLVVSVGVSRVYRGEHYPTDVLAGLVLGIGALIAGVFIIRVAGVNRSTRSRRAEEPLAAPGDGQLGEASS